MQSLAFRRFALASLLVTTLSSGACTGAGHGMAPATLPGGVPGDVSGITWLAPTLAGDAADLMRWRRSVGPPVIVRGTVNTTASDRLIIVSWNVHVGGGDVGRLLADVRRQHGDAPIVLLLQEAYREGPEVPSKLDPTDTFASIIRGLHHDGRREEIESIATSLGMHAYYVPSMRNGGPLTSAEDRGNAILSTVPLSNLSAIELPFERQRRVAVAATITGAATSGAPWRMRVVSAHLDNMSGARRLWFAGSEFGRRRQARGLVSAIGGTTPVILGADLNTLFGFRDSAYLEAVRAFPDTRVTDRRATFGGLLRLDHLFFRLDDGWAATFRRADDKYDSDHYPLVGLVEYSAN
jgi:endonuclease/exonuclease/phosphatase family metal-dependent hydrolase